MEYKNRFEQLENNYKRKNWSEEAFSKSFNYRFYTHPYTAGLMMLLQKNVAPILKAVEKIERWWDVD